MKWCALVYCLCIVKRCLCNTHFTVYKNVKQISVDESVSLITKLSRLMDYKSINSGYGRDVVFHRWLLVTVIDPPTVRYRPDYNASRILVQYQF